ncbi:MAG: hypothetical protein NVSMB57_15770 [Actinomycetota bacterium]
MANIQSTQQSQDAKNEDSRNEETQDKEQMCCDGDRTAEQHRKESPDGKCCVD